METTVFTRSNLWTIRKKDLMADKEGSSNKTQIQWHICELNLIVLEIQFLV